MALSQQEVKDLKALPGLLGPLLPILGLSNPLIAGVTFAYGLIFRLLDIGEAIRGELDKAGQQLEEAIKAQGLFRVPIKIDTPNSNILDFLEMAKSRYPKAYSQLEGDRAILRIPGHPQRREAFTRLSLAREVIPKVYDTYETEGRMVFKDDPLLDDVYLRLYNPGDPKFYWSLVENLRQEKQALLSSEDISLSNLEGRIPTYLKMRLGLEQATLDLLTQQAFEEASRIIREKTIGAILGPQGLVKDVKGFVVERVLESVEQEITAKPPEEQNKNRLDEIKKRRKELEGLKERINEANQ